MGPSAFDRKLPFDEMEALKINLDFLRRDVSVLKVTKVEVFRKEEMKVGVEGVVEEDVKKAEVAVPGVAGYRIF